LRRIGVFPKGGWLFLDDHRKKIIISEIENWRKNHLLPEHYCIFLLNLYTAGEHQLSPAGSRQDGRPVFSGKSGGRAADDARFFEGAGVKGAADGIHYAQNGAGQQMLSWNMFLSWLLGASVIAAIILLAFHFNGFSPLMQIAIFSCFALVFYILSIIFQKKIPVFTHLSLAISFLILTAGGIYMIKQLGLAPSFLLMYLTIVCLLWFGNGLIFRFAYYLYCGMLGLGILYGFAIMERVSANYTWWTTELYWVPLSLLMIGSGFLLHERNRELAGALAICGMIFFFGAEIQSLYIDRAKHEVIQLLLFSKVFLSSALFFLTRRYWFAWFHL
jgi:hypothetical protein